MVQYSVIFLVLCSDPDVAGNATFHFSATINLLGSLAFYDCNTGFELTSGDLVRACTGDGFWTGSKPVCTGTLKPLICIKATLQLILTVLNSVIGLHMRMLFMAS